MKECEICGKFTNLSDAIVEAKSVEICDDCARTHGAITLKKPSTEKLKEVERVFSVRERLEESAKIKEKEKEKQSKINEEKTLFPETLSYQIKKAREKEKISRDQLAKELGINVEEIDRIELGETPSEKTLRKFEQFFKTEFKKEDSEEEMEMHFKEGKSTLKEMIDKAKTIFTRKTQGEKDKYREFEDE